MTDFLTRTRRTLGDEPVKRLELSHVAVFGIGGVGGHVCEALVRSGIGAIDIIDKDRVCISNLNRQIIALHSSLGRYKTDVMKERILDINPDCKVNTHRAFFLPENASEFDFTSYDYVVDAIDTVTAKLELVKCCKEAGTPIISAMGAGNKLDPSRFEVSDIMDTTEDPLARVMRRELRKRGIDHLKVVYSKESPRKNPTKTRMSPGSLSFVPGAMGLIIAGEVIKDLSLQYSL
ncbi:tRNA threonylcarbamoyladenosine dehydratase [Butyrivibrio sp. MC2013]|uniref:tRNA threonylcarbamoyladenosine dehydratase n=1 Tax=Butyrivibrio sp. MC2013 TaxID=1280686 RepID=UPI000421252C|nr:tRNA threonylcarbamoyladenosine dehydratase [Butyrivibrio sp. MC2013]